MLEIFRDDLYIHCDTSAVPYQGSVNVPIKLTEINEGDLYSDYAIQPKVSYHDGTSWLSMLLPYEDGGFSLPSNVFAVNGIKKIAIGLIKGDKEYVTNDLKIIVNSAPTGTLVLPTSPQWNELVDAYMEQQYNNSYKVTLDEYLKDFNKLLEALEIKCDATINEVNQKISTVYKPCGSVEFTNLPVLADEELGNVYNLSDDFTTTEDFIEGEGLDYPAGTNIAVVEVEGVKMFDVLAGMFDMGAFIKKDNVSQTEVSFELADEEDDFEQLSPSSSFFDIFTRLTAWFNYIQKNIPKVNLVDKQIVIGGIQICWGRVSVSCIANTTVSATVSYPASFANTTDTEMLVVARTNVPGSIVEGVSGVTGIDEGTIYVRRVNSTSTNIGWLAIGPIA